MLRAANRLVLIVGSAAIGAAGAVALRADLLVGYGVGRALEAHKVARKVASTGRLEKAEVGDEVYWLTRSNSETPSPFDRRLVVGDRITIAGSGGRARTLEVVDLTLIGGPLLRIAADGAPMRLMRVTARVVDATESGRAEFVHFFIEVEEPKAPALPGRQDPLGRT